MNKIPCVYVIDDDPIFVYSTTRLLKDLQLSDQIRSFENGKDAIFSLGKELFPSVVLVDINMPKMNAWEFVDQLVKDWPSKMKELQVYVLSYSMDPRDRERALEHPEITDYLLKPISTSTLENLRVAFFESRA